MGISFEQNVFHLCAAGVSYCVGVRDGKLIHLYWGKEIQSGTAFEASNLYQERYLAELDAFCKEQKRVQREKQKEYAPQKAGSTPYRSM